MLARFIQKIYSTMFLMIFLITNDLKQQNVYWQVRINITMNLLCTLPGKNGNQTLMTWNCKRHVIRLSKTWLHMSKQGWNDGAEDQQQQEATLLTAKKIHKYANTNYIEQRLFEAGSVGTLQTVTFYFMWQKPGLWQAFGVLWYIMCMNATLSLIYLFTKYLPYCLLYKY